MRRYFTRRGVGLHLILLVLLPTFALLTWWQLERALGGNTLSWAYTFEWPLFAAYAIYMWWQLVHQRGSPRPGTSSAGADGAAADGHDEPGWALSGGRKKNNAIAASHAIDESGGRGERFTEQTPEEAAALADYNRYLAELDADDRRASR